MRAGRRVRCGRGGRVGGGGAEPARAAPVARGVPGPGGRGLLLGEVVVDVAAAARQGEDEQDDGERALGPGPRGAGERRVVGQVEAPALGGQPEALRPAVDGGLLQGSAVEGGVPAVVGAVGDAQDAALRSGGDVAVRLDGAGADGDGFGTRPGASGGTGRRGDDDGAGDLAVDPPQGAAVALAEPAEAGVASRTRAISRGAPSRTRT